MRGLKSYSHIGDGGKEIRTPDNLRAKQVLYQLSYTPVISEEKDRDAHRRLRLLRGRPERLLRSLLLHRKEVIQPQVPLRLPCYDLTPVTSPTVLNCPHCWLAHLIQAKKIPMA